jgi:hypothetical protein
VEEEPQWEYGDGKRAVRRMGSHLIGSPFKVNTPSPYSFIRRFNATGSVQQNNGGLVTGSRNALFGLQR